LLKQKTKVGIAAVTSPYLINRVMLEKNEFIENYFQLNSFPKYIIISPP
jgi:hypothetical protein